jgi:hypothetical protein
MKHLTEEQLVQQYYGDTEGAADRGQHLAECEECRSELERLKETLDSVAAFDVPERNERYGEDVWNNIRAHLPEPEKRRWFAWPQMRRWVAAGALAALIVVAFFLGRISKPGEPTGAPPTAHKEDKDNKVLLVALGDHLERSQMVLVELTHVPSSEDVDISSEQRRAEDLLSANRLYRQAAVRNGDADLAAVLDDLERVLTEVTHEPSKLDSEEMQSIQKRIEAKGILFKVRVIGSKVRKDEWRPEKQTAPIPETTRKTT